MQGLPGVGQIQSVSVLQSGEQPSPPWWLPSSQVSAGGLSMPFPQGFGTHVPGPPSQETSARPPMSGVPASCGGPIPASPARGVPPWPPLPLVPLPETPAQPPSATIVINTGAHHASRSPSQAFTCSIDGVEGRFGSLRPWTDRKKTSTALDQNITSYKRSADTISGLWGDHRDQK